MNHCRRCDSDYEKPGTCNCFAPVATPPLTWPPNVSFTCPFCGKLNCYETHVTAYGNGNASLYIGDLPATTTGATIVTYSTDGPTEKEKEAIERVRVNHFQTFRNLAARGKSMMGGDTSHMLDQ